MHNLVIYDWLSITSKIHDPLDIMDIIGIGPSYWTSLKGAHGYRERFYYESISIHFSGTEEMGVWLEMSGQGCRAFETYGNGNYDQLFQLVNYNAGDMKITRLDVAYDDHSGVLDIGELCADTLSGKFISRFNDWQVIQGSKGCSVTHGSMKSDIFIRIYDKAAERGLTDGSHWIRVEIQMRKERAMKFAYLTEPIGVRFSGVLLNYLRYVEPDGLDSNKWRWPLLSYWADLIETSYKISLFEKPGTEYNLFHLENFVVKQAGNAIDAYIQINGLDNLVDSIKKRGTMPNPKYIELVDKFCNSKYPFSVAESG